MSDTVEYLISEKRHPGMGVLILVYMRHLVLGVHYIFVGI